jgi:hypothetical protein
VGRAEVWFAPPNAKLSGRSVSEAPLER